MTKIARSTEGVEMIPGFPGLNALQQTNTPNIAASYFILKPFDERHRSAAQISAELSRRFAGIRDGFAYALMPPPAASAGVESPLSPGRAHQ